MPKDSLFSQWRDRWIRRGEILAAAAFSAAVATAASGTWLAVVVALVGLIAGIYVIAAAEGTWWLPGRKGVAEKSDAQTMNEWMRSIREKTFAGEEWELRRIADSLERLATALAPRDPNRRQRGTE
jgi:hypothetical protein